MVVDSPLAIPAELSRIELAAGSELDAWEDTRTLSLVADGADVPPDSGVTAFPLPASFVVAPRSATSTVVELRAASGGSVFSTETYVVSGMRAGEVRVLEVVLDRSCAERCVTEISFDDLRRVRSEGELDAGADTPL